MPYRKETFLCFLETTSSDVAYSCDNCHEVKSL
ncbi:hypothetical protein T05_15020 [Trichinella murrelli]|uniref:Uncharacterized protein n=1 Tax=Trichinella murrelli TaxID=144512 RepID=A0A0V0SQZ7_9BILA|nr:hypothetical protein T05_15020 [Trichinella murrelli]